MFHEWVVVLTKVKIKVNEIEIVFGSKKNLKPKKLRELLQSEEIIQCRKPENPESSKISLSNLIFRAGYLLSTSWG